MTRRNWLFLVLIALAGYSAVILYQGLALGDWSMAHGLRGAISDWSDALGS